jgi:hypothetical protein
VSSSSTVVTNPVYTLNKSTLSRTIPPQANNTFRFTDIVWHGETSHQMRNDTPSGRDWDVLVHQKREGNAGDGPPRKKQRTHHTVDPFAKSAKGDWLKGGRGNVETFIDGKKRHTEYRLENQRQEAHQLNSRQRKK